ATALLAALPAPLLLRLQAGGAPDRLNLVLGGTGLGGPGGPDVHDGVRRIVGGDTGVGVASGPAPAPAAPPARPGSGRRRGRGRGSRPGSGLGAALPLGGLLLGLLGLG